MAYVADLENIEIVWVHESGWRRRCARVTFLFEGTGAATPQVRVPILIDAQTHPDAEIIPRAWATLHDRLGALQAAAASGAVLSNSDDHGGLREA